MFASLNKVCATLSRPVDGTGVNCQIFDHRHLCAQPRLGRERLDGLLASLVKGRRRCVELRHRGRHRQQENATRQLPTSRAIIEKFPPAVIAKIFSAEKPERSWSGGSSR
jgi:hypothetical protein